MGSGSATKGEVVVHAKRSPKHKVHMHQACFVIGVAVVVVAAVIVVVVVVVLVIAFVLVVVVGESLSRPSSLSLLFESITLYLFVVVRGREAFDKSMPPLSASALKAVAARVALILLIIPLDAAPAPAY